MDSHNMICLSFLLWSCFIIQKNSALKLEDEEYRRIRRDINWSDDYEDNELTPRSRLSQLQDIVRQAKTDDGSIDLNRLLQDQIQDPVPIADFNVTSNGILTDFKGHFQNMQLHGLKKFRVEKMKINLSGMNLSADMFIPTLSILGNYRLDGSFMFMQISGDGGFWMNLTGITIKGNSQFYPMEETGQLTMGEVNLQSEIGNIELYFDNLMGGGAWSRISNSLLNQLSELILDELKHSLLKELGNFLRSQFNDHLFQTLPADLIDPESPNVVDSVLKKVSQLVHENGLDPLPLPDHEAKFERDVFFFTTKGEITLSHGYLHGLSSLSRRGDVIIVLANDSIMFEAGFGFKNLTGAFDWDAKLFDFGPEGDLQVQIKSIDGFLRFRQNLKSGSKVELDSFYIKDIRHIWLDINGLGTWDYLVEIITNVLTNGIKLQIADSITEPVKAHIQREISTLNFTMN